MSTSSSTPIAALLRTVFDSILEVFLLCFVGYILAYKGILDKSTQKKINHLNVSLFTPALLFSKVAFFLTPAKLRELWVVPLFFILVTLVSMLVALSLGWMFGLKKSQTSFAMAAAMFMNSNSLPIALMQSLVVSVPHLKWGKDDNKNAMVGRALTYLVVYSTLGMVLRWSYGVRLLSQADDEEEDNEDCDPESAAPSTPIINERTPLFKNHPHYASTSASTFVAEPEDIESDASISHHKSHQVTGRNDINSNINGISSSSSTLLRPPIRRRTTYYNSFPNSPSDETRSLLPSDSSDSSAVPSAFVSPSDSDVEAGNDGDQEQDERGGEEREDDNGPEVGTAKALASSAPQTLILPTHIPPIPHRTTKKTLPSQPTRKQTTRTKRYLRTTRRRVLRFWTALNNFMTVPLWAALASIIVACVRPLQHVLESHIVSFKGALGAAGNCSIPLTLVVLGAYFYSPPSPQSESKSKDSETLVGKVKGFIGLKKGSSSVGNGNSEGEGAGGAQTPLGRDKHEARKTRGETKTVAIAVLSRMVITPLLLMPLVALSAKYDWQKVFEDPVFVVANVLLVSSPPALTLAQITQAASGDAFERLISRTIFWSYCVLTPPATIFYVVLGLILAR